MYQKYLLNYERCAPRHSRKENVRETRQEQASSCAGGSAAGGLIKRGQIESMPWASDDIDIDIGEDADSDVLPEEGDEDAARGAKVRPRHFLAACPASVTQVAASGSCSAWECGSRRSPPAPP